MEHWLKRGQDEGEIVAADKRVRETVEGILADIAERGDAAVRELSVKFRQVGPRQLPAERGARSRGACRKLSKRDIADITFAQTQVRTFARAPARASMHVMSRSRRCPASCSATRTCRSRIGRLLRARAASTRCSPPPICR